MADGEIDSQHSDPTSTLDYFSLAQASSLPWTYKVSTFLKKKSYTTYKFSHLLFL